MSLSIARRIAWFGLLASGCASEDGGNMGESQGADESSTAAVDPTAPTTAVTTAGAEDSSSGGGGGDTGPIDPTADESSSGAGSTGAGDVDSGGSEDTTAGEVLFDEDFVWVADFMRANCVVCHSTNANGNLLLPAADLSNDEVRLALDGVVATTGLKLVEPGDRNASQTYLQITNEFGAQFPVEDTDRFGAWIDAGANYFAP